MVGLDVDDVVVALTALAAVVVGAKGLARLEVRVANGDRDKVFEAAPSVPWSPFMLRRSCDAI